MQPLNKSKIPGIHPAIVGAAFVLAGSVSGLVTFLIDRNRRQSQRRMRQYLEDEIVEQDSITLSDVNPSGRAKELTPEMLAAVMVAVRLHRRIRRKQAAPAMRTHQPGTLPSRWIGAGRVAQTQNWHKHRK
ncbi:MAG TPA: hypothetical protein VGK87_13550 [Anaerolineae bacterium]|jgi:hypothetical protein